MTDQITQEAEAAAFQPDTPNNIEKFVQSLMPCAGPPDKVPQQPRTSDLPYT